MASGDVAMYVGDSDVTLMPSIVDISGRLNDISKRILANASAALSAMAHSYHADMLSSPINRQQDLHSSPTFHPKRIGITMFGLTTPGVNAAMSHLETFCDEATGNPLYEPVVFHATGSGGRSMERLVDDGWLDGILDITTTELADELCGGVLSAGPTRLTAAGRKGIPQVVSLGALDMVNFGGPSSIPAHYTDVTNGRKFHEHNSSVTLMRTNASECAKLGEEIARKLKDATGPTTLVIPTGGWSGLNVGGLVDGA